MLHNVTYTPSDPTKKRIRVRIARAHLEQKLSTDPGHIYILYNTIRIKIRMTMDNAPKYLNLFFIYNDLNVALCTVCVVSWHFST